MSIVPLAVMGIVILRIMITGPTAVVVMIVAVLATRISRHVCGFHWLLARQLDQPDCAGDNRQRHSEGNSEPTGGLESRNRTAPGVWLR